MLLNCHSYYSLRYGTFSEEELVDLAIEQGYSSVGLTDINTTSGILSFLRYAQRKQIKGIVGIDFRNGASCQFVGIAPNEEAYFELNSFLAKHLHESRAFETKAPAFEHALIVYPFEAILKSSGYALRPNEYIGVSLHELRKLRLNKLIKTPDKLVLLQPVSFRSKRDFNTHRLLRAIDNNTLLSKLSIEEQGDIDHQMLDISELKKAVNDLDFLLEQTTKLSKQCSFEYPFDPRLPSENQQLF